MKRNYYIDDFKSCNIKELATQVAYHEAGHATAIYLYNKQQQLPPIFFRIHIKKQKNIKQLATDCMTQKMPTVAAIIEGGCLIENLTLNLAVISNEMTETEKAEYYQALDADIINLLAGSIAEKNYIILRDNEVINAEMLNIQALECYGNYSDMQKIKHYLSFFSDCPFQQQQKLTRLLKQAFEFITHQQTWRSVEAVANYILDSNKQSIHCEEIFKVIDAKLNQPVTFKL